MKNLILVLLFVSISFVTNKINGQEAGTKALNPALDIYSSYIWRGTLLGNGPALQPSLVFSSGGFTAGVWGSFDVHGYQEADPYFFYKFPFGLSLGMTDYYYPGMKLGDFSTESGSHALEMNAGYTLKGFSLTGNFIVNEAGGAGSAGNDLYFEAGYYSDLITVFVGAGDGWHTSTGNFNICNVGIGSVKKIRIGENFILPLTGRIIVNPEREKLYVVAGISF